MVDLEQLEADYHKAIQEIHQKTRNKRFNQSITRSHRYHEEKSIWEYLNNIVEDIHLFTWRKTVIASCTDTYKQKRFLLEEELRDLDSQHRNERITLRFRQPTNSEEHPQDGQSREPHISFP